MLTYKGDIIVVEPLEKNIQSSILIIPDIVRDKMTTIRAKVIGIGELTSHIKKLAVKKRQVLNDTKRRDTYFPQDDLQIGDVVFVKEELGTRSRIPGHPTARIYDSEDVLAKEEWTIEPS